MTCREVLTSGDERNGNDSDGRDSDVIHSGRHRLLIVVLLLLLGVAVRAMLILRAASEQPRAPDRTSGVPRLRVVRADLSQDPWRAAALFNLTLVERVAMRASDGL